MDRLNSAEAPDPHTAPHPVSFAGSHPASAGRARAIDLPPTVCSRALMQGRHLIHIEHNGAIYRLQATRQGKLILTK